MKITQVLHVAFWATLYVLLATNTYLTYQRIIAVERLDASNKMLNTTMERLLDK